MHIVGYITRNLIKTQGKRKSQISLELKVTNGSDHDSESSLIRYPWDTS